MKSPTSTYLSKKQQSGCVIGVDDGQYDSDLDSEDVPDHGQNRATELEDDDQLGS